MKKIILVLIAILSIKSAQGVISWSLFSIVGQNFNTYHFKIVSYFPFGDGFTCPDIYSTPTILSLDTIYLRELYNVSGMWPTFSCVTTDTVDFTNIYPNAHYINISTGYYYEQLANPGVYDTVWSVHDSTFLITPLSIAQHSSNIQGIKLYPNPNHGEFTLELDRNMDYQYMDLRDIVGRVLYSEEIHGEKTIVHFPELMPGHYILRLEDKKNRKWIQQTVVAD